MGSLQDLAVACHRNALNSLCCSPLKWPRCLVPVLFQGDPFGLSSSKTWTLKPVLVFGLHLLAVLPLPLGIPHPFALNLRLSLCVGVCPDPSGLGMGVLLLPSCLSCFR